MEVNVDYILIVFTGKRQHRARLSTLTTPLNNQWIPSRCFFPLRKQTIYLSLIHAITVISQCKYTLFRATFHHIHTLFRATFHYIPTLFRATFSLNIKVFDVSSANPKSMLRRLNSRKHFGVVGRVGDEGEHNDYKFFLLSANCFMNS